MLKTLKRPLLAAGAALLAFGLASLFYDQVLARCVQTAYDGKGFGFLTRLFTNRHLHPASYYIGKLRSYYLYETAAVLLAAWIWVALGLSFKKISAVVRDFFQAESHPLNLAVFRIVFFLTMLLFIRVPDSIWFSRLPSELLVPPTGLGWLFPFLPVNPSFAAWAGGVFIFFCFTGLFGLFSRTSAWMVFVSGFYVVGLPQFYGKVNHDHHLLWFAAMLGASRSGDAFSFDALVAAWKQTRDGYFRPGAASRAYGVPLRFIWILFGVIYFFPGFWKLLAGPEWTMGENLKFMLYDKWAELGGWLPLFQIDQYPVLYKLAAFGSIFFEMSFIFLIFSDRLRPLAVWGGLAFHNLTYLLMKISFINLQVFYVAFFDWHKLLGRLGRALFKEPMFVLFDGNCRLCRGTVGSLRVLDILGRVTYVNALDAQAIQKNGLSWLSPQALLEDMHAVAGRRVWKGYESYRALAVRIPLFWPVLPFLWIWPVTWFGRKIYRGVADSRRCAIADKVTGLSSGVRQNPRSAFAVGIVLVAANILCGFGRIESAWPFACYPTFSSKWGPEKTGLVLEAEAPDGKAVEADIERLLKKVDPDRFWGLVNPILALRDENERQARLKAFWRLFTEDDPPLRGASVVRFYSETRSTLPEEWHTEPLRRKLLYEMREF